MQKTKIIAELGTLHLHDDDCMMRAVEKAFRMGADFVKTQCIYPRSIWWATQKQHERYCDIYWAFDEWVAFFAKCKVEFDQPVFASVFDIQYVDILKDVVDYWKISNKLFHHERLVNACLETEKPTFISIEHHTNLIQHTYGEIIPLYIQPEYPVKPEDFKLPLFGNGFDGLSIHWKGDFAVYQAAMTLGAKYIEVHVQGDDARGPDVDFALDMNQLERLCFLRDYCNK